MIHKLLSTILIGLISIASVAQEVGSLHKFNQFLSKNLQYSSELRSEKVQGPVTLLLSIDEQGSLKKSPSLIGGSEALAQEVFRIFELMEAQGTATILPSEIFGEEYLLSVEFKIQEPRNIGFYIPERPDSENRIIKKLNEQIQSNPYFPKFYQQRAEYFKSIGQDLLAELDEEKAKSLKAKELTTIVVVGYHSIHKKLLNGE
ncbi:hypothetical protein E4S40_06305 [Algoriphagus kandeliae]|uniref:TonB C-terminal domain-containing protein n=1 Tax=Algoriphagus kandeliae TaxID=2562278 RepID=A0A4Y9QTE7_9BACT|nr:hypothetical protein [Algoriphagus kandeliae]TFV95831.1 hypothetical protein E4S40_06305 [Algoriphagus kandeliae]